MATSPPLGFAPRTFRKTQTFFWSIRLSIATSVVLVALGLWRWGAVEVRGHFEPVFFLTFLGFIWLMLSLHLVPWLGLSVADDAIERQNRAALVALCGATFAVAIIYVSGNFGEGPSYWNNIFSAGLGTLGLLVLWSVLEFGSHVSISIAEERDLASGIRLCGFLLAAGLILGRAVAGNWHSESATVRDFFHDGWPAGGLCLGANILEWFLRPTRNRPFPSGLNCGLMPAVIYVAAATAWVCHLGRWEGMPT